MTADESLSLKARAALVLKAAFSWIFAAMPDLVGLAGLALLTRGLWLTFGEGIALAVSGGLMIGLALLSALLSARRGAQ